MFSCIIIVVYLICVGVSLPLDGNSEDTVRQHEPDIRDKDTDGLVFDVMCYNTPILIVKTKHGGKPLCYSLENHVGSDWYLNIRINMAQFMMQMETVYSACSDFGSQPPIDKAKQRLGYMAMRFEEKEDKIYHFDDLDVPTTRDGELSCDLITEMKKKQFSKVFDKKKRGNVKVCQIDLMNGWGPLI